MHYLKIILFVIIISGCYPNKTGSVEQVVQLNLNVFDSLTKSFKPLDISHGIKMWQKDSLVIQEIKVTTVHWENNKAKSIKHDVLYYLYINMNSKKAFTYTSFTDTAKLLGSYNKDELANLGAYDLFDSSRMRIHEPITKMKDTIMRNDLYSRYMTKWEYIIDGKPITYNVILYSRCDKKKQMFRLKVHIPDDCPVVRSDALPEHTLSSTIKNQPVSPEFIFLSDSLTTYERKVIEKWKENENNLFGFARKKLNP